MIGPVQSHNPRLQATKARDLIHRATNEMLIEVGRMLLENRAALLRTIYSFGVHTNVNMLEI